MNVFLNELPELHNILHELVFEDEPTIFDDEYTMELLESVFYVMEDYMNENPTAISEPDFEETFLEEIKELFYIQFEGEMINSEFVEDDLYDILEYAFQIFTTTFCIERSNSNSNISNKQQFIQEKIDFLKNKPQPPQRTNEWYDFRHNLITASNAYKVFEGQSTMNQLIYEKCQPLKTITLEEDENVKMVNINTTLHWGQKYEPVSVMLYEYLYKTKIDDFGCIQHSKYPFLGASPDGINVDVNNSELFGRMLEIKNIVNREINGIPKKEYWIQMQLQMEVCDLDECDFLETKFTEYENAADFFINNDEIKESDIHKKGVIVYFHNIREGKPLYLYKPINIVNQNDILKWEEEIIELYQTQQEDGNSNIVYVKTIYWKLEKLSCVVVLRNKNWFENNFQSIEKVWNIIENERKTGYQHRAPNKKIKKEGSINVNTSKTIDDFFNNKNGCLINIKY
jgi:putative phage-type endonuclease